MPQFNEYSEADTPLNVDDIVLVLQGGTVKQVAVEQLVTLSEDPVDLTADVTGILPLTNGGLGATTSPYARENHTGTQLLSTISDAGSIASQAADSVTITGGSISNVTLDTLTLTGDFDVTGNLTVSGEINGFDTSTLEDIVDGNFDKNITITKAEPAVRLFDTAGGSANYKMTVFEGLLILQEIDGDGVFISNPFEAESGAETLRLKSADSTLGGEIIATVDEFEDVAFSGDSDDLTEGVTNLLLTTSERTKLDGISTGAEVNQNAFTTVAVSGQDNVVADSTTDTLTLTAGSGITLTTNNSTDTVTITNSASLGETFKTIAVSGQDNVVADSTTDTLTLVNGTGIGITTTAASDSITISVTDAELTALAGLTSAADKLPYFTGTGTADVAVFTAAARQLLDDTTHAAMLTTLSACTESRLVETEKSLTGGGELTSDLTLSLVNDETSPGNLNFYGTDASGTKGWFDLPGELTLSLFDTGDLAEGSNLYYTDERVDDRVNALLQEGTGITLSYNDGDGTLTIDATATAITELDDVPDVTITTVQDNDVIIWNTDHWENTALAAVAFSNDYDDLDNTPSLGTMSAESADNYTATSGLVSLLIEDIISNGEVSKASSSNAVFDALALKQPLDAELTALAGLTSGADALPYFTGIGTANTTTLTAFARSVLDDADEATFKATVNLEIGTDVQAYDAELAALAGLTSAADKLPYFTDTGTAAVTDLPSFGRTLVANTTAAEARTDLVVPASDPTGITGADAITNMMSLTTAEYGAITPNATTLYFITDA